MKWKDSNLHSPSTKSRRNAIKPHFKRTRKEHLPIFRKETYLNGSSNHYSEAIDTVGSGISIVLNAIA